MYLKTLEIRDFRNLKAKKYEFSENVNVLLGKNAQGKTNILEAIYLFLDYSRQILGKYNTV